jgi:hypothetical protein
MQIKKLFLGKILPFFCNQLEFRDWNLRESLISRIKIRAKTISNFEYGQWIGLKPITSQNHLTSGYADLNTYNPQFTIMWLTCNNPIFLKSLIKPNFT